MDYNSLKYIIAVNNFKSISKAAEEMYVTQPNISKIIQNVEKELGFPIFTRTSRGVTTTIEGQEFISKANEIVKQYELFQSEFINSETKRLTFNISYPKSTYLSFLISEFVNANGNKNKISMSIVEATSSETIESVLKNTCDIGIVRFNKTEYAFCKNLLQLNNLVLDIFNTYSVEAVLNKNNSLASKESLKKEDLLSQTEIVFLDLEIMESNLTKGNFLIGDKFIKITDRATQFSLLTAVKDAYMFSAPISKKILEKQNLVSIPYENEYNTWYDAVIYKKSHTLTEVEKELINYIKKKTTEK